ncbi:hypothetical protein Gasu2_52090 [Galdieria sulphuraria]|uniref:Uncharacterized protein n=1 Tax=Galdieria sulphuraria TaxID=130081 RepID=M2VY43_GALSU|nr:uncharacterized protein Gasu_42290 [Galdieria sulphuraria]EME28226.1 hypothetical protein Gasu_42290 [Galdieria sulphuraria]GJD11053.1 hypothetical protein Gasu2_52090 [Galdieria sulphuraria]|eukprot:XP_005704746.1 hypothetical protein Gasu_42290 [Galdieria sulphuraria]
MDMCKYPYILFWFVLLSRNCVFAWETCCTLCNNELVCNGQVCGGLFQACGAVYPGSPNNNCDFNWSCETSTWRIVVFVVCIIVGIGGFLICIYIGFRWLSYHKFSRGTRPANPYQIPVQRPAVAQGIPTSSWNYPTRSYLNSTNTLPGTTYYEPSAPPPS